MYYNYSDLNYINQELAGVWPGWTAVKLLGRGSFGAVYEIHRTARGNLEKAAMKVLRVPENDAEIARMRFQGMNHQSTESYYENLVDGIYNEIRIMQSFVGYSHIVSYEDYAIRKRDGEIGWDIFIRMELLTGLPDYMSMHPMNDQMIFKLGMDIAQGLHDCHNKGVIHRDVKPENIFVNESGNFKLGDFGVSRNAPGSQDVLSFKGTLGYMAPEVYRMQATDARSDIYSLGMVLYQCLNDNRLPFVPENFTPYDIEAARQRRLAGEPISAPAHGSKNLKSIVLKAVAERPEDRFQTAEEMYYDLMAAYKADYSSGRRPAGYRAEYQNTVPLPTRQEAAANNYARTFERGDTAAAPQAQYNPGQNIQYQNAQYQNAQFQNAPYQQPVKKPFPLIPVVIAVAVVLGVIAALGISTLFREPIREPLSESISEPETNGIQWKDAALEAKMREITGIASGDIMISDVENITELNLSNPDDATDDVKIKDISALSNLTRLTSLNMKNNSVSDVSALGGLTNLKALRLLNNQISDISAIRNLTNLTCLSLSCNQISDISAVGNLTNLRELYLKQNNVSDISAIRNLTNLRHLNLNNNQVSDISALAGLTNLKDLKLYENNISDISALRNLTNLTILNISHNPINDYSPIENLNISTLDR